ncbi:hypothetical protein K432DRAFT_381439 [Lepidopterella palustris CBS 459.81]|uniref:DUF3074 domain-containing protein n=1 Tax=Lepidopterella palustris CBS 459.81 TaxID=1314670 RepID=A0A8E2JGN6_9PEZI|nr:hypothetical protein K432DRAFT_381439 [Lepidopterella palustris CBS 459.81]
MSQLHEALSTLRPKDFADVPLDELNVFLADIFAQAELIANSVPPPPGGCDFQSSRRSRSDVNGATSASEITVSPARPPPPAPAHAELQQSWGKPLKLSAKDSVLGISVFKMAGSDRHGAWFARRSIHEGLGFEKWRRAMMREFPESLAIQGGPGEGNVRGIGGDRRLESKTVNGVGKLEVYQLSAQFPGPTAPREFITLLLTSDNCLTEASKVSNNIPRHYMVVSIPVSHPDAPQRNGLVRGFYESVELIREIPLTPSKSSSTANLLQSERSPSRVRAGTIGFAESRGPNAKGERIDIHPDASDDNPETNPVEWIMVTRSDPGGGIPRFMVERNTPSSIVVDAGKFLDWACAKDEFLGLEEDEEVEGLQVVAQDHVRKSFESGRSFSASQANGYLAGVGTSIADKAKPATFQHPTQEYNQSQNGTISSIASVVESGITNYAPEIVQKNLPPALQHTDSHSSSSTEVSSLDSFASAEQFNTAEEVIPNAGGDDSKELQKIESKKRQLDAKLAESREKETMHRRDASLKSEKELVKVTEKHTRERKKQEERFAKEVKKLEERREKETRKLIAKRAKEVDKNIIMKAQKERDEWKVKAEAAEKENALLKEQIGELQRENTTLVARIGKTDGGLDVLRRVKEELEGKGRARASSRASATSRASRGSKNSELHSPSEKDSLSKV